jgi:predicted transcriptional regulator
MILKKMITLRLDEDLLARAKIVASKKKTTLTQLITDTLLKEIERQERIEKQKGK